MYAKNSDFTIQYNLRVHIDLPIKWVVWPISILVSLV